MTTTQPRTRFRAAIATIGGLALTATLVAAAPAAAASPTACRVKNLDTGVTKYSLQKAHDAARRGHRLTVRGTCVGITTIRKSLVITGTRNATSGKPFLDGKLNGTVVTVLPGVKVAIRDLTIRNGATTNWGGGISNRGSLILRDVIVRGNTAQYTAGGIFNEDRGTLTLNGTSTIRGNSADIGGGVYNFGALTLNGTSTIRGNTAAYGGGVHNEDPATLTLTGGSSIADNTADYDGGGVFNDGILRLKDSSRISQNSAGERGGGVYHDGLAALRMRGSSAITGNDAGLRGGGVYIHGGSLNGVRYQESDPDRNNVRNNTPDDVLDVMLEAQSET